MTLLHRERRDDARAPAPRSRASGRPVVRALRFVIRKPGPNASQFELRMELDGVVKCWAIPRNPDTDPAGRRVALHTEDQAIDDSAFESIVDGDDSLGELWDQGTWIAQGPALASYRRGQLKFELRGRRMKGHWTLARMGNASTRKKDLWLLVRRDDAT